jgi:nitrate reductase alpha subunit
MLRLTYNPAYPYHVVMMKHGSFIATEKTVKAQQTRPDGLSLTEEGYISNFRFGSQQSITRNWHMPMHQTDTLFHKAKAGMNFIFGCDADNHAVNIVPKECLVRITKAEDGGMGGRGAWKPGTDGSSPDAENERTKKYFSGGFAAAGGGGTFEQLLNS